MNRLLQGEVGSGKTVVAAYLLRIAAQNQLQSALLAPTEILAEQHESTIKKFTDPEKVKVALLTASTVGEKRDAILRDLSLGKLDAVIGTHAVLQETVQFNRLGLVIVDEQHKFGVRQRSILLARNPRPHLLIMSATPIPRTLGLTLYGDLDISTIHHLPKGRQPIETRHIPKDQESEVFKFVLEQITKGEQAYILFPMIDETGGVDIEAATQEYERLKKQRFKNVPVGLVHGRMTKEERDRVMSQFQSGKIQVLVATSVIEVGVDNPNATMMLVRHADRFGLSQLHQIRGRIGRGEKKSICFLFGEPKTEEGKKRLEILTRTQDGFEIAEEDLKLRGPGEFFGLRQSGNPLFRLADLLRDHDMLTVARQEAKALIDRDPSLTQPAHQSLKQELDAHLFQT